MFSTSDQLQIPTDGCFAHMYGRMRIECAFPCQKHLLEDTAS